MGDKKAIIFPGVGYHSDKPLLYFGKKLAREFGYRVIEVSYSGFKYGMKGNPQKMQEAFELAMVQTEECLKNEVFDSQDEILVISKSIGTAVAGAFQKKYEIEGNNIYFTPVDASFTVFRENSGIVFHGTGDSWANTENVRVQSESLKLPLYLIDDADHSLEVGDARKDIEILAEVIKHCKEYLEKL